MHPDWAEHGLHVRVEGHEEVAGLVEEHHVVQAAVEQDRLPHPPNRRTDLGRLGQCVTSAGLVKTRGFSFCLCAFPSVAIARYCDVLFELVRLGSSKSKLLLVHLAMGNHHLLQAEGRVVNAADELFT